nr:ABC transporter permease [Actinomycetales bacterium]
MTEPTRPPTPGSPDDAAHLPPSSLPGATTTPGTAPRSTATQQIATADIGAVYTGLPTTPLQQAAAARRWGWWYFAEHWARNTRSYIVGVLFYDLGALFLNLVALGLALGTLVDAGTGAVDGVSYLMFVAPALVVSAAVMTEAGEMTYPVMEGFKWRRLYYGPSAGPLTGGQIAFGHQLVTIGRLILQGIFALLMLWAFGALASPWSWLIVPISLLAGLAFGAPLQAYAATLKDEGFSFSAIQRFVVMPMFLFAGTFFPLT